MRITARVSFSLAIALLTSLGGAPNSFCTAMCNSGDSGSLITSVKFCPSAHVFCSPLQSFASSARVTSCSLLPAGATTAMFLIAGAAVLVINTPAHTSAVRRSPFPRCFAFIERQHSRNDLSHSIVPPWIAQENIPPLVSNHATSAIVTIPTQPVPWASMPSLASHANVIPARLVQRSNKERCVPMNRFSVRVLLLIFPSLCGYPAWAQSSAPHVEAAKAHNTSSSARIVPVGKQQLFGSIPVSTRSKEARRFVELSLDKYENHIVDGALSNARRAIQKDPQFALGYAVLSLASLGSIPDSAALGRAKALLPRATPDEQLLIRWMTSIRDGDLLPAISAMNDLLKRFPDNKHVLYILADWLYSQQDYDRSRQVLETVYQIDPDFPPALNLLGYAYIQTGTPDLAKAIASLQRYAEVQPNSPNPQDSLGEVLRFSGDDQGSLEHYSAALQIDPTYISSRYGLGDTSALMGNYIRARAEYDEAIAVIFGAGANV